MWIIYCFCPNSEISKYSELFSFFSRWRAVSKHKEKWYPINGFINFNNQSTFICLRAMKIDASKYLNHELLFIACVMNSNNQSHIRTKHQPGLCSAYVGSVKFPQLFYLK